jgi:hypothetical protein
MVQMIENWSDVEATVVAVETSGAIEGHGTLRLEIGAVAPVEGFADLMADYPGRTVDVQVRRALLDRLDPQPGDRLRLRLRRGGPTAIFAHPEIGGRG